MATGSGREGTYSAAASALGYLYQVRYALLEALRRLRRGQEFLVSLETLDDVLFEKEGAAFELLQCKHHVSHTANLTDSSSDIWKTLRLWCDALRAGDIMEDSLFFLITTAKSTPGTAAFYLSGSQSRDAEKALQRLKSKAASSTNQANLAGYDAFKMLDESEKLDLCKRIYILDSSSDIAGLDEELRAMVFGFAPREHISSYLSRLEGWWLRRVIKQLYPDGASPISSEELDSETSSLREQFRRDNLPVDDDVLRADVDASVYIDRCFVKQLELIDVGGPRITQAIRDYFRAFTQRSRWVRENLVIVGELDRYHDRLVEEWSIKYNQMCDDLGESAAEESMKLAAMELYKWVESGDHPSIRPDVNERMISRGSYQFLSDDCRVGWHAEFGKRLRVICEDRMIMQ